MWHLIPLSLYSALKVKPDLLSNKDVKTSFLLFPKQEIIPMPVITTLFMQLINYLKILLIHSTFLV